MKCLPTMFVVIACAIASPALAQSASPPAVSSAASPPTVAPAPSNEAPPDEPGSGGVKAVRQACRADADAKGLKGPAKREAVSACVVQKRPDQAAREACRSQGFAKGLRKQELHAFVKDCLKPKG